MKRVLIIALVCINVALLTVLVLGTHAPKAHAQAVRGGTDYVVISGQIGSNWDAVYIIDQAARALATFKFDKSRKRLLPFRMRDLKSDFRRQPEK
ncbi:MAG: hypothetical protein KAU28_08045 [Phycisphaerae bacterium]|nr:hypothetical protein [Phycisphaerae bacterium]